MRLRYVLAILLLFSSTGFAADGWSLNYGTDDGKIAVYNANTDQNFKEDQPFGPMSFRINKGCLWLLDSIGSRIYKIGNDKKATKSFKLPGMPENLLLEDFALINGSSGEPESVWVAEAANSEVKKISLADGKELVKIGGSGNEPGKFQQINQLEVDRTGRLYVGDIGRAVLAVFTPYGELVRELPWQQSGFALDKSSRLHTLHYSVSAGYFIKIFTIKGQLEKSLHLGMPELTNPRVWAVTESGSIIVSFVPAGGFKGTMKLFEISPFGKILRRLEFSPPAVMNRYLAGADGHIWLADADFAAAPAGEFVVKSMKWSETR